MTDTTRRLDSLVTGDRFLMDGITHTVVKPLFGARNLRMMTDRGELRGLYWSAVVVMAPAPVAAEVKPAPEVYVRGTKTTRVRTGKLTAGMRVLTDSLMTTATTPNGAVRNPAAKTGAIVRTVTGLQRAASGGGFHRSSTYYVITFADGTVSRPAVAHEAWSVVVSS